MNKNFTIYVPVVGGEADKKVPPRSAIVGFPAPNKPEVILAYFDGVAAAGAAVPGSYYGRLVAAASRMVKGEASAMRAPLPAAALTKVGTFDAQRMAVAEISDASHLTLWAAEPLEAIIGRQLPHGVATGDAVAKLIEPPNARELRKTKSEIWYRTQAGQIIRLDPIHKTARVFDRSDLSLPRLLKEFLDEAGVTAAIGTF
jgi:hypothetical protein